MTSQKMAALAKRIQGLARRIEVLQDDLTLHYNGVMPDMGDDHWKKMNTAHAEFISASDEFNGWMEAQLFNPTVFKNEP